MNRLFFPKLKTIIKDYLTANKLESLLRLSGTALSHSIGPIQRSTDQHCGYPRGMGVALLGYSL